MIPGLMPSEYKRGMFSSPACGLSRGIWLTIVGNRMLISIDYCLFQQSLFKLKQSCFKQT